jgi:heme-degrading monooxygenase HmoA
MTAIAIAAMAFTANQRAPAAATRRAAPLIGPRRRRLTNPLFPSIPFGLASGEEDAFVHEWTAFVTWACSIPGSGTFRLVRDLDRPSSYMSFAPWASFEAQRAWNELPEFRERIGRVRSHCDDFQPSTHELITEVA